MRRTDGDVGHAHRRRSDYIRAAGKLGGGTRAPDRRPPAHEGEALAAAIPALTHLAALRTNGGPDHPVGLRKFGRFNHECDAGTRSQAQPVAKASACRFSVVVVGIDGSATSWKPFGGLRRDTTLSGRVVAVSSVHSARAAASTAPLGASCIALGSSNRPRTSRPHT